VKAAWILAVGLVGAIGCGSSSPVTVVATATPQDNFFLTWEIDSLRFGTVDCASVGAATVVLDLENIDSGQSFITAFDCNAFEGTSAPVDVGRFSVLVSLSDSAGDVIDQIHLTTQNVTVAGTVDLGHVVFQVP
jgi:hypothetical protein